MKSKMKAPNNVGLGIYGMYPLKPILKHVKHAIPRKKKNKGLFPPWKYPIPSPKEQLEKKSYREGVCYNPSHLKYRKKKKRTN